MPDVYAFVLMVACLGAMFGFMKGLERL